MTPDRFLREREQAWAELDRLVAEARGRAERLGPDRVLELGRRYRAVVADLALARRSFPGDPVVARLEQTVGRARHLVYGSQARRRSPLTFLATGYWQRVRERPVLLAVSGALLLGPLVLCALWARDDPATAARVVPEAFQAVTEPKRGGADLGMPSADRAAFSIEIFVNNIRVAFAAFAGGISAGLLTAAALLYNGLVIGVVTGLAVESGNGDVFFQLVVPHGVLELSCIVVAGAA
ncbi:MAG TPA: stage II sporulation protein M, partial [Acidimicrobiales bacterium]|nr:stage II sporulation protein M [Acidimicrobiales bacterium]